MTYIVGRIEDGGLRQDWTSATFVDRDQAVAEAKEARGVGRLVESGLRDTKVYALVESEFVDAAPGSCV